MIKTIFIGLFLFVLAFGTYLYCYLGAYKSVTVTAEKRGPLYLLYQTYTGPYHEIGSVIHTTETFALAQNLPCPRTFGEFLDDPERVDQDRLRSRAGCLLAAPLIIPHAGFEYEVAHREGLRSRPLFGIAGDWSV